VVVGGELVAAEVAEFLATKGKRVTMLRRGGQWRKKLILFSKTLFWQD